MNVIKDAPRADVGIIAIGTMVPNSLKAAALLEQEGYSIIVADAASLKPLDRETVVRIAKSCRLVVTVEEHSIIGGLGGAVAEVLAEDFPARLLRIGIMDVFGESGSPAALYKHFGLTPEDIGRKILKQLR
jgi:transketolase